MKIVPTVMGHLALRGRTLRHLTAFGAVFAISVAPAMSSADPWHIGFDGPGETEIRRIRTTPFVHNAQITLRTGTEKVCRPGIQTARAVIDDAAGFQGGPIRVDPFGNDCVNVRPQLTKECGVADNTCLASQPSIKLFMVMPTHAEERVIPVHASDHIEVASTPTTACPWKSALSQVVCSDPDSRLTALDVNVDLTPVEVDATKTAPNCAKIDIKWNAGVPAIDPQVAAVIPPKLEYKLYCRPALGQATVTVFSREVTE